MKRERNISENVRKSMKLPREQEHGDFSWDMTQLLGLEELRFMGRQKVPLSSDQVDIAVCSCNQRSIVAPFHRALLRKLSWLI